MSFKEIEINNLTKKFKGKVVLNNLSLTLNNKDYNVIQGYNGIGKTTLIKCIMNFIRYKGNISNKYSFSYMPEKIVLPRTIKLHKLLKLICRINTTKKRYNLDYWINVFNLNQHLDKTLKQLSLGTIKKISLIKTLIEDVDLYIFDEPINALDLNSINLFRIELEKLKLDSKLIIIISHNINILNLQTFNLIELSNEN